MPRQEAGTQGTVGPCWLGIANGCLSGNNELIEDAEQAGARSCTPNSLDPGPAVSALVHLPKDIAAL